MPHKKPYILGITGASGAGKSYLAQKIQNSLKQHSLIILQDNFYRDLSHYSLEQRAMVNFDHPDAVEFDLLIAGLNDLIRGMEIVIPLYDFSIHNRKKEQLNIKPKDIIIVEGTLLFTNQRLRQLFDLKIFLDTPLDICFIRRLARDCQQRGRSADSVIQQYLQTVRPMYLNYIKTSRKFADMFVDCSDEISEFKFQQIIRRINSYF
jgi:uridine kinase